MNEMFRQSLFAGVTISLIAYEIGLFLKRKLGLAILNPLLVSIVIVILALKVFGISYEVYNASAKYISYLLTPATVCLAVPLYEQLELLKKNKVAVVCGILSGTLASLTGIFVLCMLFGFNHQQYVTMLPKSPASIGPRFGSRGADGNDKPKDALFRLSWCEAYQSVTAPLFRYFNFTITGAGYSNLSFIFSHY